MHTHVIIHTSIDLHHSTKYTCQHQLVLFSIRQETLHYAMHILPGENGLECHKCCTPDCSMAERSTTKLTLFTSLHTSRKHLVMPEGSKMHAGKSLNDMPY